MTRTMTAIAGLLIAANIGLTASLVKDRTPDSYSLVGLTDDGNAYVVDHNLTWDDCRKSTVPDSYCDPDGPRLVGLDCEGASGPIYAASESDFPPCRYIARIGSK